MKSQEILNKDCYNLVVNSKLKMQDTPISYNQAVDVGTSKTRGMDFRADSNSVDPTDIVRIPNEFSVLSESDVADAMKLEFETKSFNNLMLFKLENKTNKLNPLFQNPVILTKGLTGEKLLKTSNYSVSNTSKFRQTREYVINTYCSIITTVYKNIVKYLEAGNKLTAEKFLNIHVNLACMLPDEENNSAQAEELLETLKGVVEYELPLFGGIKGKFTINNQANQRLDIYGEAECVIYYYIIKNKTQDIIDAFMHYGTAVVDVGEGSFDTVFFKKRELITRASSTNRNINGSTLITRTIRNIERDTKASGINFTPTEDMIKRVLEKEESDLMLITPRIKYDIAPALNEAKYELAGEAANVFKSALEKNSVFGGVDNLFLLIFAGRTMVSHEKSASLGSFIANRLNEMLDVPQDTCKVTHPDSNILGASLKMLMYLNSGK